MFGEDVGSGKVIGVGHKFYPSRGDPWIGFGFSSVFYPWNWPPSRPGNL